MKKVLLWTGFALMSVAAAGCCGEPPRLLNRQCNPCNPCNQCSPCNSSPCGCANSGGGEAGMVGPTVVTPGPEGYSFIPKQ